MRDMVLVAIVAGLVFSAMAFAAGWFGLWNPHESDEDE